MMWLLQNEDPAGSYFLPIPPKAKPVKKITFEHLFEDDEEREAMISACREDGQRYPLDTMIENFCSGISLALKCSR